MTSRDVRAKYAGSLMGIFWSVINPLLLLAVFTFIFAVVFKARFGDQEGIAPSALYILSGILPWLAFSDAISRSATVILENKNLVTRARFPLPVLPAFPALSALSGQLIGTVVLIALAAVRLAPPGPSFILIPLLLALQVAITIGIALAVSATAVYVRDLIHALPVLLLVWMYATPVFYPARLVPEKFSWVLMINPMAWMVEAYRTVLLEGAWPPPAAVPVLAGFALFAVLLGAAAFSRLAPGIPDRL